MRILTIALALTFAVTGSSAPEHVIVLPTRGERLADLKSRREIVRNLSLPE